MNFMFMTYELMFKAYEHVFTTYELMFTSYEHRFVGVEKEKCTRRKRKKETDFKFEVCFFQLGYPGSNQE